VLYRLLEGRFAAERAAMNMLRAGILILGMALAVGGCACRSGYVGPYGGVHPGGCVLF
jgi:hypothetical protein